MATSNSIDFKINAAECIKLAFQIINILNEDDYLSEHDAGFGLKILNMMIKGWQNFDNHLWAKQTATLFLQNSQRTYTISGNTTDHLTVDEIAETTLLAAVSSGSTTITVPDSSIFVVDDYIGIKQDNNYLHWSTVSVITDSTTIQINDATTEDATVGNYVFGYTNKLQVPFQVYSAIRHSISGDTDIRMDMMAYEQYEEQPVKDTKGTPVQWSYDRQLSFYKIKVWPSPGTVNYYIHLVISRKLQDIDSVNNDFDFPQEWEEALVYNLALKLAPSYGKAKGDNFIELKNQAKESLAMALGNDNELGSIFIKPNAEMFRGKV